MNRDLDFTIVIVLIIIILVAGGYFLFSNIGQNQEAAQQPTGAQAGSDQQRSSGNYTINDMRTETLVEGSGNEAKNGDTVTVNYLGMLENGTKFDSSYDREAPFDFILGQGRVIQGWELGVLGMKVVEKRKLTIPPELGYGADGYPPVIPENATLIFEVELLAINGQ